MGGTLSVVSTQPLPDLTVKSSVPLSSTLSSAEASRQRTLLNMTAAMSGQEMQNPEDRPAAEAGRKAGMVAAAETVGGVLGGEAVPAVRGVVGGLIRMLGSGAGAGAGNAAGQAGTSGKVDVLEALKTAGVWSALSAVGEIPGAWNGVKSALGKLIYTSTGELSPVAKAIVHPTELPETLLRKTIPEPPTYPGASQPQAEDFYANKAKDLMTRETQQRILDNRARIDAARAARNAPQPTAPSPFGNATATDVSSASSLPQRPLPSAGDIPQGNPTPFGQPQLVSKFTPPGPGRIQSPNSAPPPINKTLVSYDRRLLVEMAKGGDLNALRELIRNPGGIDVATAVPNSKYLLEGNQATNIYGGPRRLSDLLP